MKILIINAYSSLNRGDAGIVVAMARYFEKKIPGCQISVMSSYFEENKDFYKNYGVESVSSIWILEKNKGSITRLLTGIKCFIKSIFFFKSKVFSDYRDANLIVSAGGGYLYSSNRGALGLGMLNVLFHYWLGVRAGKPIVGFPQSVGPFNYILDKWLVGFILRKCDLIFGREPITTALLNELRVKNMQVNDIAFSLRSKNFEKDFSIGVTVMDWKFAQEQRDNSHLDAYLKKIATILQRLISEFPTIKVKIYPQVDVSESDSDYSFSLELHRLVNHANVSVLRFKVRDGPDQIIDEYSRSNVFLASRLHSAIFALVGNVQTIALAYQPKSTGTFESLNLREYVHDISQFEVDLVHSQLRAFLSGESAQPNIDFNSLTDGLDAGLNDIIFTMSKI